MLFLVLTFYFITAAGSATGGESFPVTEEEFSSLERNTDTLVREIPAWLDQNGMMVRRFQISNTGGLSVTVMTYGAAITNLVLPGEAGGDDIVLGFDNIAQYQSSTNPYFGATVGRVANRISGGHFSLAGVLYNLTLNNNGNTLHGGEAGWDKKNWKASVQDESVVFRWSGSD